MELFTQNPILIMLFYSNLIESCVSSFIITFPTTMGATKDSNYGFGTLLLHNKSTASSARKRLGGLRQRINDSLLLLLLLLLLFFSSGKRHCDTEFA